MEKDKICCCCQHEADRKQATELTEACRVYRIIQNITNTKGIIDDVTYFEKTDSIKKQIEDLRVRRNKLLSEDEDERCIEELRHLKRILNDSPKTLSEIDKELFTSIVTNIYAEQNGDITFCLLGELQLRMEVK